MLVVAFLAEERQLPRCLPTLLPGRQVPSVSSALSVSCLQAKLPVHATHISNPGMDQALPLPQMAQPAVPPFSKFEVMKKVRQSRMVCLWHYVHVLLMRSLPQDIRSSRLLLC